MQGCPLTDEAIAYSLRQMSAVAEQEFREHLASCTACRLKLSETTETLELLPFAVPPVSPPPGLKAKVLERVARESAGTDPRSEARRRWTLPVTVSAAAAVAVVLGTYALLRVEGLQQRILGIQQVAAVERSVALTGTEAAPAARGEVLFSREDGGTRISLRAREMPPLQPGEAYQLWLIKDGKRTSGGVFVVDATGRGGVATWLPGPVEFDALGITREPDALGLQPRGPKVLGSI